MTLKNMELKKEDVLGIRKDFFDNITKNLQRDPDEMDEALEQSKYFSPPMLEEDFYINNINNANLYLKFNPSFYGTNFEFSYSIFNPGDQVWISVIFENENSKTAILDEKTAMELNMIWDRIPDGGSDDHFTLSKEWRFEEPLLYINYAVRERFIHMIRYMHFKILKMFFEYAREKSNGK